MGDTDCKLLIVGVGNVLQGDDGFGVELANSLMARTDLPQNIKLMETGIGGMSLIQELMQGYDALLILDAYMNDRKPGYLSLLEPLLPDLSHLKPNELRDYFSDTHYATPMRALHFLEHVSKLPKIINILGCEPERIDDMQLGLSEVVAAAIPQAEVMVVDWIGRYLQFDTGMAEPESVVRSDNN